MGITYGSSGCLGADRKERQGQSYADLYESWKPQKPRETNVLVTPEEAFMIKKQTMLNLHYIPC